ncbi:uncharacterized protein N7459_005590 [Penicillium hispanicum]|uniref:uncharacterized protein n=1 Tax=Penicillium hispanicum TaxID=1080232 RepID=UPI00253FA5E8|nr:uncharacterized protein N7459_005590 [Penicillium hispanicum]KAJ5579605.1 hypothetical protein N7459_005590 [Penicillium hispanicum]
MLDEDERSALSGSQGHVWQTFNPKSRVLKSVLFRGLLLLAGISTLVIAYHQFGRTTPILDDHAEIEKIAIASPPSPSPSDTTPSTTSHTETTTTPTDHSPAPQDWRSLLPPKIWQVHFRPAEAKELSNAASWLAQNRDYQYVLVSEAGAEAFIRKHFHTSPTLLQIFQELNNTGIKSDLLRYLILWVEGGVYSDIDTVAHKPVDVWVPARYQDATRLVIGIEFDRRDGGDWAEVHPDLQFCQWTIAAAPGHAVFRDMIEWSVSGLESFAAKQNKPFSELEFGGSDVIELTGPSAWTDAIFRRIQEYDPEITTLRNFTGLTEPVLVGDILILPIDGFGMGQPHSGSTADGSIPEQALIQHLFWGSWRHSQ